MYDKIKKQILAWYKEHPTATIAAGVALVLTVGVLVFFGSNSTLFQGSTNLADIKNETKNIGIGDITGSKLPDDSNKDKFNVVPFNQDEDDNIIDDSTTNNQTVGIAGSISDKFTLTDPTKLKEDLGDTQVDTGIQTLTGSNDTEQEDDQEQGTADELTADTDPIAGNLRIEIEGDLIVGTLLRGEYDYFDADGDLETDTNYRWLRGASADNLSEPISIGTQYELTANDAGKFIAFEVTPVNAKATGSVAVSQPVGPVESNEPDASAPVGSSVEVIGEPKVGATVLGSFEYADADGDEESGSIYNWYRVDAEGNPLENLNVNQDMYQPTEEDVDGYLAFSYIPRNAVEPSTGEEVVSAPFGPIVAAETTAEDDQNDDPIDDPNDDVVTDDENTASNQNTDDVVIDDENQINDDPLDQSNEIENNNFEPLAGNEDQNIVQTTSENIVETPPASGETNLTLTSNTNANLLGAAEVQGNTGPEALLMIPFLGFVSFRMGRRLAKRK